jgi:acetyltransferase-like isoleucine patch superfamily enzyme
VSPASTISHPRLRLGAHVFIDDRVLIFQDLHGGIVDLADRVHLYRDTCIQTGSGGSISIGADTHVQARCQFSAYQSHIRIGRGVHIAPNCAFYPYDHGIEAGCRIIDQPLSSKGDIIIDDDAWIGTGVIVLSGVRIGKGAVIGAGSVVTANVPDDSIAVGAPARVVNKRLASRMSSSPPSGQQMRWAIGIYVGPNPCAFSSPPNVSNPVLSGDDVSDVPALFVADPFMVRHTLGWHMLFEVMNQETHKGEIGWATSVNGYQWKYQRIVLREPFHLSYPYVFEWQNQYYMIPESHKAGSIRLYRAIHFPNEWALVATLLQGHGFADSSIFRYRDKWWLLSETNPEIKFDTLRLYYADTLYGPWHEHPQSPIVEGNPHIARPAGRVLVLPDRVIRYAQDCYPVYGTQVSAYEITELTTSSYCEKLLCAAPVLSGSGVGWNAGGMHHIDPHWTDDGSWLACVDGWYAARTL